MPDIGPMPRHISAPATDISVSVFALGSETETHCGQSVLQPLREYNRISAFVPFGDLTASSRARSTCRDLQDIYFDAWSFDASIGTLTPTGQDSALYPLAEFRHGWNSLNRPGSYPVISPESFASTQELETLFLGGEVPAFVDQLARIPLGQRDQGLCLDLSDHPGLSSDATAAALRSVASALGPAAIETCLIVDVTARALADVSATADADRVILQVKIVDLSETYQKEPLLGLRQAIARIIRELPAEKLRIALNTQGFTLSSGQRRGRPISFVEAMNVAAVENVTMSFSAETGLHLIRFVDKAGVFHQIWLPDAEVVLETLNKFDTSVPVVLWPIGYEDPAIWMLNPPTEDRKTYQTEINLNGFGAFGGNGPFSVAVAPAQPGLRTTAIQSNSGDVLSVILDTVPVAHSIRFFGDAPGTHTLSIAFQGLPSQTVKLELLELLDQLDIYSTFFLSTQDTLEARNSITLLREEGHEIGSTLNPQSALMPFAAEFRNKLTQHLLAFNTGRQARFVLAPNVLMDSNSNLTEARLRQVQDVHEDGYILVRPTIFTTLDRAAGASLLGDIYSQALVRSTNLIVFDISTLELEAISEVLQPLLLQLKEDGFDFRSLTSLADITPQEAAPTVAYEKLLRDYFNNAVLTVSWNSVQGIIFVLALVLALRYPVFLFLALIRRNKFPLNMDYHPPLTLVIPAFNEVSVIRRTLESAMNVDYPDLKIIVVDDGSSDHTEDIVHDYMKRSSNIQLYMQKNSGKWSALNHALNYVDTPYMAILDADSLIDSMALRQIVQPFKDEKVGGVSGTVEIGNRDRVITAFQRIEYLHLQQVVRRAYEVFNGIIVVPGAIGAWRVDAVKAAGLFSGDTITEDADLTIATHRCNYKIFYQENAKSFTEAPDTLRGLYKQRFRWTFGMFQASWKHKHAILEGRPVGIISIIDAIWYQLFTSLLYPFFDIYILVMVIRLGSSFVMQGDTGDIAISQQFAVGYLLIMFFRFINIIGAMLLARRVEPKLLLLAPFAWLGYRQILYFASIKAVYVGVMGHFAAWNKLERSGTARLKP